jgi:hypothetical protein
MAKKITVTPPTPREVKEAAKNLPKGSSDAGRVLAERKIAKAPPKKNK